MTRGTIRPALPAALVLVATARGLEPGHVNGP